MAKLDLETFAAQIGTRYRVVIGDAPTVEIDLIVAEDRGSSAKAERFSVLFRGPLERPLSQGLYRFEHAEMGAFELFIVPIERNEKGFIYEAVFNRFRATS